VAVLVLLLCPASVWSAQVRSLEVGEEEKLYSITMEAILAAPLPVVWQRLTDFPELKTLSPTVRESEVLKELAPNEHRVRTVSHFCVLIFCGDIVQVQRMRQLSVGELQADIEPEGSDFDYGRINWILEEQPDGTLMHFKAELRPGFIVPPLIGPWLIKRMLRREALTIVNSLEQLPDTAR
jgi:hypothetical protein